MTNDSGSMVVAALSRDDDALVELVRQHHTRLFRFGVRVCGNDSDAEDAVQEAFITLARRRNMHGNPGVISWMFTVVKNWCLRIVRRTQNHAQRERQSLELTEASDCPETMLQQYRVAELVRDALASLDEPYKQVVVLRDLEGLSGEQVCAALDLSEAAMKSRLHRGRAALRLALDAAVSAQIRASARPSTNFK